MAIFFSGLSTIQDGHIGNTGTGWAKSGLGSTGLTRTPHSFACCRNQRGNSILPG